MNGLFSICQTNRRMILLLLTSHMVLACVFLSLWSFGLQIESYYIWWSVVFTSLQLYISAQTILPALHLKPETRSRPFYLFWGLALLGINWLANQPMATGLFVPILATITSSLLLLTATFIGTVLARYVNRLWEIIPVCIVMTLADIASWLVGPTANFVQELETYYRAPTGPPPLIDMVLIKLASPGFQELTPVFGISDWIMVVFFATVAYRFNINDNLFSLFSRDRHKPLEICYYLPVPIAALLIAISVAQWTGQFIPALPVVASVVLLWYALRHLYNLTLTRHNK